MSTTPPNSGTNNKSSLKRRFDEDDRKKEEEGKINIGSFDQQFTQTVKQGTPYKLIFTPLVELSNTSGLISFKVNEGVKADGTQIKLNME